MVTVVLETSSPGSNSKSLLLVPYYLLLLTPILLSACAGPLGLFSVLDPGGRLLPPVGSFPALYVVTV